jgi:hypothetical protein
MSYLQRLIKSTTRDQGTRGPSSSFSNLSEQDLETHLRISRYGSFTLTNAIRPSYNLDVVPSAGYRFDSFQDKQTGAEIPVLIAAQSSQRLMDLFIDLIDQLGSEVDVVLESSHKKHGGEHDDMYREGIEVPILKSILYDHEDMLTNDGCTGIAILNPKLPLEVQFDEHKLLVMYGQDIEVFETVLQEHGLDRRDEIKFITEAEHVHSSSEEYHSLFQELRYQLGMEE